MNTRVNPSIEEIRHSLCLQLIGAGVVDSDAIVHAAQAVENFIYSRGTAKTDKTIVEQAKSETKRAAKTLEETSTVVQEAQTETASEQTKVELADIKSALMRVAKADRNAFQAIMAKCNAENITQIKESDYPTVMTEVEKFEADNAQ